MQILNKKKFFEHVDVRLNSNEVYLLHSCVQTVLRRKVENSDSTNTCTLFDLLSVLDDCKNNMDLPF